MRHYRCCPAVLTFFAVCLLVTVTTMLACTDLKASRESTTLTSTGTTLSAGQETTTTVTLPPGTAKTPTTHAALSIATSPLAHAPTWSGFSVVQQDKTTNETPAVAVYQGKLYLFIRCNTDHHLYVSTFDGSSWSSCWLVDSSFTTDRAPAVVASDNKLFLFAVDVDHRIMWNRFDGSVWTGFSYLSTTSINTSFRTDAPLAVGMVNKGLRLFAQSSQDKHVYLTGFDGITWEDLAAVDLGFITDYAPAFVGFGAPELTYLFAVGSGDRRLYETVTDVFSPLGGVGSTNCAAAATVFRGELCLFTIGTADNWVYLNRYRDHVWSGQSPIDRFFDTSLAPAAVVYKDKLYLFTTSIYHDVYVDIGSR
jgi:hypothetical protein